MDGNFMEFLTIAVFPLGLLVAIVFGWALEKNNRIKLKRTLLKQPKGCLGFVGKGMHLDKEEVDLTKELYFHHDKLYQIQTKDAFGHPTFFYNSNVPMLIYNEDMITPIIPTSKSELVYWCKNCKKEVKDPIQEKNEKGKLISSCPTCENEVIQTEKIYPISPTDIPQSKSGQPASANNLFTLMRMEARMEIESELYKEIIMHRWGILALIILLIIALVMIYSLTQTMNAMQIPITQNITQIINQTKPNPQI